MNILSLLMCVMLCVVSAGSQEKIVEPRPHAELLHSLRMRFAPDLRTGIFTVGSRMQGDTCVLSGEVASDEVRKTILDEFQARKISITDSIVVLPSKDIGLKTWGIVTVSVANMKSEPREAAELGTQALMGGVVRVFKQTASWFYIQSPDQYLGWADGEQFLRCTQEEADAWKLAEKVFVRVPYDFVKAEPSLHAAGVCDVVGGAVLKKIGEEKKWMHVSLADGRMGYILKSSVVDYHDWGTKIVPRADNLERTARQLLGIPYLWGGTSVKAMDCSGFMRTVYLLNGVMLKRDANQQAEDGVDVAPGKNWENLRKGDLLFFGRKAGTDKPEKITHVAMYLGNLTFIHSSGKVRLNSFDPASPIYNAHLEDLFVRAKRMLK